METSHPSTRADNSASGNRALVTSVPRPVYYGTASNKSAQRSRMGLPLQDFSSYWLLPLNCLRRCMLYMFCIFFSFYLSRWIKFIHRAEEPKCKLMLAKSPESAHKKLNLIIAPVVFELLCKQLNLTPMTPGLINRQIRSVRPWVHFSCRGGEQCWIAS